MEEEQVWHYVLPFPLETKKRKLIWSILQSKVGKSLLMNMDVEGRTYQKDVIHETSYSNKSIIEYLKRMVSAGILEEGMEQVVTGKRKVRVKWYVPTNLGRWFILFLKPADNMPAEQVQKIIKEIFQAYAESIIDVCQNFGTDITVFRDILNSEYNNKTETKKEKK